MYRIVACRFGVLGACLLLSGCLLITDVNGFLNQIEDRQLAVVKQQQQEFEYAQLDSSLPNGAGDGTRVAGGGDITEVEEKVYSFIEKHRDKPDIVAPLYVRLGILYIQTKKYAKSQEAFADAKDAKGKLSSSLQAYADLGRDLVWWYSVPNSWNPNLDLERAETANANIKGRIDALSGSADAAKENRDTLMWLHNVRVRIVKEWTSHLTGAEKEKNAIVEADKSTLKDYLDFWGGDEDLKHDAVALAVRLNPGVTCSLPAAVDDPYIGQLKLRDIKNLRWSIQVFCNVSDLLTRYHEEVVAAFGVPELDIRKNGADRDWINCKRDAQSDKTLCKPISH